MIYNNSAFIIMPTYFRKNGKSKQYLERSIQSIINQTYKDWTLVIIGDKYEPKQELDNIISKYNSICNNKIVYLYNTYVERDIVKSSNKRHLWHCAGANACNMGLEYGLKNNFKYFFSLDDDDYWKNNHLSEHMKYYNENENCFFVVSQSTNRGRMLPLQTMSVYKNNLLPIPCGMINSAFSFRNDIFKFKHKNVTASGWDYPGDAFLLGKIKDFLINNKQYYSIYNSVHTCYHDEEFAGY